MSGARPRRAAPVLAAAAAVLVAGLGGLMTDLGPWYASLKQPPWKPSDLWFGPVWTLIFALTALAGVQAWTKLPAGSQRRRVMWLFAINILLNLWWSALFFRLHRPDWSLYEVGLLWLSILGLIISLRAVSRLASLLMVPYLAWVSFASVLNWWVVELNGPFSGL